MRIFELEPDTERFPLLAFADERATWVHDAFDGTPLAQTWEPLRITVADEPDSSAELGDYHLLGVIPTFSDRAVQALGDILRRNGELLPLRFSRGVYFAYNVTEVLDALDEGRSTLRRFPGSERVMHVERYVFRGEEVRQRVIFKIPQFPKGRVFVTDGFVSRADVNRLSGMRFRELWDDSGHRAPDFVGH